MANLWGCITFAHFFKYKKYTNKNRKSHILVVSQPYFERVWRWDSHSRNGDLGVLRDSRKFKVRLQGSNTPRIGVFFISLESYRSVNVKNGLGWAIWTFAALVMAKRKVGSQTGSLTPNHWKLGINSTPMHAGRVGHIVEKLSTRITTSLQTSSRSEVWAKNYNLARLRESKPWQFQDSSLGVLR